MPGFAAPIALDGGARGSTFSSIRLGTVAGEMPTIATTIANVATAAGTLASEMTCNRENGEFINHFPNQDKATIKAMQTPRSARPYVCATIY